ncbi:SIS domain-containing protein [Candidatus Pelagibacter sp.]|nr:SIS domain-containing protein [Candidatus Pelagibacter sp.]
MNNSLLKNISEHNAIFSKLHNQVTNLNKIIKLINKKLNLGGKILLCGNGGSAADAQHLAAEFLIRLRPNVNRRPIPAISLSTDISTLTACGNDYKFDDVFLRPFIALSKKNDVLLTISTSGNSKNIIKVLNQAKKDKITTIGFLGNKGGKAKGLCDYKVIINSKNTARIQEAHIFLGHFIFTEVENLILKK